MNESIYFESMALQSSNVLGALPILRVIPDWKNIDGTKLHAKFEIGRHLHPTLTKGQCSC
ncbi:unnamed protein product [Fusarium graminearum]|nr:unnamed protein product [Fusarium graminearum]CAG1965701.1 unnamed protein product [Fusarium graminearum]CAG1997391.1 unnamed protein product [Fusarium graminearum]VTO83233.1 unnamed protein product [Fusarium graminearum]